MIPISAEPADALDHDVPLDGAWSDLTAQFEFLRRGSWCVVALHDLHIL